MLERNPKPGPTPSDSHTDQPYPGTDAALRPHADHGDTGEHGGAWLLDFRDRRLEVGPFRGGDDWNLKITLPAGIQLSGRAEYHGGWWIRNTQEAVALSRQLDWPA